MLAHSWRDLTDFKMAASMLISTRRSQCQVQQKIQCKNYSFNNFLTNLNIEDLFSGTFLN